LRGKKHKKAKEVSTSKKRFAIQRVERKYLSGFIQLLPHILQQLGKVTVPFVEFQLLVVKYLFCYLN
jgi:membrane protease subunit (stomatin/prohibitin family)